MYRATKKYEGISAVKSDTKWIRQLNFKKFNTISKRSLDLQFIIIGEGDLKLKPNGPGK